MPGLGACPPPVVLILPHLGLGCLTLSSLDGKIRWYGGYTGQEVEASHYPWTGWREASQLCTSPPCLSLELGRERLERRLVPALRGWCIGQCLSATPDYSYPKTGVTGTTRTTWGQRNYISLA